MKKHDKYNKEHPSWGYRLESSTKEDLEAMLLNFGSKQAVLSYLIKLGLQAHQQKLEGNYND